MKYLEIKHYGCVGDPVKTAYINVDQIADISVDPEGHVVLNGRDFFYETTHTMKQILDAINPEIIKVGPNV